MPLIMPTTQEITDQVLTNLENALNQDSPLNDKAFLRVLSAVEGMSFTQLWKFGAERAKQNLALTATGLDLERIGINYGVIKTPAIATILNVLVTCTESGTTIVPAGAVMIGDTNGIRYSNSSLGLIYTGPGTRYLDVTAFTAGAIGNLSIGDTLTLETPIAGITIEVYETDPAVDPDLRLGVDKESEPDYRRRVLNEIRTVGGGGNGVDYRTWSEQVPGVSRTFPYASAPIYPIPDFLDSNMEAPDVYAWTSYNDAILTKETADPYSGLRNLKVAVGPGSTDPFAGQAALAVGRKYRINGYARSDGTNKPEIRNDLLRLLWQGTISTNWQNFDFIFQALDGVIYLGAENVLSGYVEFDEITLTRELLPGDRTVYVEVDASIDPDGIAPQTILDQVRDYINTDPDTGQSRPPLGLTDETLYVFSIFRTTFYVEIRDLIVEPALEFQAKLDIEDAIDEYFKSIAPFVDGVDVPLTRDDTITDLRLSEVVQNILNPIGATAAGIGFGTIPDQFISSYVLGQGELAKLGTITYV